MRSICGATEGDDEVSEYLVLARPSELEGEAGVALLDETIIEPDPDSPRCVPRFAA